MGVKSMQVSRLSVLCVESRLNKIIQHQKIIINTDYIEVYRQVTIFNYDVVTIKTDVLTLNQTQPVERDGKWFNH